jgi:DMSO/TMAO reductase YedYZ molybdopterin-dependent catalytic subunit
MNIVKRRLIGLGSIGLVILLFFLLAGCQSATCDPQPDASIEAAPAPILPPTENYTLPLTPIDKMHITGIVQHVDISGYRLTIDGMVENPLSLTYQDILAYPSVTEIGVIDCPGYFVDIGEWTGVPLATILAQAGLKPGASKLTFSSMDGYKQTLSLEHVNEFGVFLAYKVNGQTLPPEHGYPLRVVDNGSAGAAWVKWVENIRVE